MTSPDVQQLRQQILGSRRASNYWWATVTTVGATGFLLAGLSSYLQTELIPFASSTDLIFIPQGLAMGFYGVAGLLLSSYLWLMILWDVGSGYNEFDRKDGKARIFRWGFPGKNRKIEINCDLQDVQAVKVDVREGLNPKRVLYLRVKGRRDIPLTRVGQPLPLSELESQGATLARFLGVPLEGLS
ncbi:photosystem I assembly protein [Leptolyngbya sp. 'hensonii']|uniref:photosystem I assembly protein Ycf4 n=1 Tax=Leptolyngbya sp. 'hensonii' TaxID=1922337 RepID=UPI00094F99B0|nr:photosystem I assembly protein Ycf4 [Leptolyngbya sp. 'hensonii']OLP16130.1 photosystem I assembly protein [Leptolyngbya sp. 'hensonii']